MNTRNNASATESYSDMPVDKLGIYIMDIQHPYLKKSFSTFLLCSTMISNSKDEQPVTRSMSELLGKLGAYIAQHLQQDENVLFPFLRSKTSDRHPASIDDLPVPYRQISMDHRRIAGIFAKVREVSNHYTPLPGSSPAIRLAYAQLFNFEQDVLKHIFLEEDLLFPKLFRKTI